MKLGQGGVIKYVKNKKIETSYEQYPQMIVGPTRNLIEWPETSTKHDIGVALIIYIIWVFDRQFAKPYKNENRWQ